LGPLEKANLNHYTRCLTTAKKERKKYKTAISELRFRKQANFYGNKGYNNEEDVFCAAGAETLVDTESIRSLLSYFIEEESVSQQRVTETYQRKGIQSLEAVTRRHF
jgi:hypothetical protein